MNDDATLLRRFAENRSGPAFAEIVERHIGLVYAAALRQLGGAVHRAEDVTQSVFVDLARNAERLSQRTEIVGWLYTSTHYAAAKLKRSERRRQMREQEAQLMHEVFSPTSANPEWERLRPVLDDAMLALEERDREAILMRYFQARRFADVGRRLGLSEDAARMRVDRALEKLRALLVRRGIGSTTAALSAVLASQSVVAAPAGLAATITGAVLAGHVTTGFLMSTPIVITAVVAIAALGTTVYQTSQVQRAETALASIGRERDSLRSQLRQEQQQAAQAAQRNAVRQAGLEAARPGDAAVARSAPAASPIPNGMAGAARLAEERVTLDRAAAEVEARRAFRRSRSVVDVKTLETAYRALYRQLNFSPEQIAQFKTLANDNAARHEELDRLAAERGMKVNDAAMLPLYAHADADFRAKLGGTFGAPALQAFQHYAETLPLRPLVEQVAASLFYTDAPLNARQVDQLVEILSSNLRNAKAQLDPTVLQAEAVLAQAQTVLAPSQLAAFRALVAKLGAEAEAARKKPAAPSSGP